MNQLEIGPWTPKEWRAGDIVEMRGKKFVLTRPETRRQWFVRTPAFDAELKRKMREFRA